MPFDSVFEKMQFVQEQLTLIKDNEYLCAQILEQMKGIFDSTFLTEVSASQSVKQFHTFHMFNDSFKRVFLIVGNKEYDRTQIINIIKNCRELEYGAEIKLIRHANLADIDNYLESEDPSDEKIVIAAFNDSTELLFKKMQDEANLVFKGDFAAKKTFFIEMTSTEYIDSITDNLSIQYFSSIKADDLSTPDFLLISVKTVLAKQHYLFDDYAEQFMKKYIQENITDNNVCESLIKLMLSCCEKKFVPKFGEDYVAIRACNMHSRRVSEELERLGQALEEKDEIFVDEDGILHFNITDDGEGLKTLNTSHMTPVSSSAFA